MGGFNPLAWGSDPTQFNPPAPDPTQNQPANVGRAVTNNMGSFAGGPPAGTQDLENLVNPSTQNLGNALQNQQQTPQGQPGQQPGQGQAPNFADPLAGMISDLSARHAQLMQQTQQPTGGPVKRLLSNFFAGAGSAMMRARDCPTPICNDCS
jgi:hypothetical protein